MAEAIDMDALDAAIDMDLGGFDELSDIVDEEDEEEEEEDVLTPFMRYIAALMQLFDAVCSEGNPVIHYTMVSINDRDNVAGAERLLYNMNLEECSCVSDLYLCHQILLTDSRCNISEEEWRSYCNRLTPENTFTHSGNVVQDENRLKDRLVILQCIIDHLEEAQGNIMTEYQPIIEDAAETHGVSLYKLSADKVIPVSPYLLFYECNVRAGKQLDEPVQSNRGSIGWGHHQDFPALRLIRLILKYNGPSRGAMAELLEELGNDEEAAQQDTMYQYLAIVE